ncbi:DNA-binding pseudobarrel domain-containing protein [Artemisia annua]|uniref:DNA-binding pseudobarrel domain-containing protein n=1 Tax=Artemisia annua TaxID=35608 RepID=A0A2U1LTQ0_ARTAN|nr:DNA-binding pseudobarrel domain-containing protein [Artemisia annua]
MGKVPVKIKSVVYALSPFQQKVMPGLFKELMHKATHKVTENWLNTILLVGPVVGTYTHFGFVYTLHISIREKATGDLMAEETTTNSYEEARKQQLLENKKRLEELGILKISRNLSELSKSKKFKQREVKPKIRNAEIVEPRRSTRARNPIITYPSYVVWRRRQGRGRKWVLTNAIPRPKFKKRLRPETTLDSPAENDKTPPAKSNSQAEKTKQSKEKTSTSKSNSQDKNTKKSEEIVTGTRRSTRLRN